MEINTQAGVLSFEDAYEVVRAYCRHKAMLLQTRSEEVPLLAALGRVLAEPVVADRDFPPFPRATRDGYAVCSQDLENGLAMLRVVGQVKAGDTYDLPLALGEAVEIMTGAAVPAGADAVVMVEHTARKTAEKQKTGRGVAEAQAANTENVDDIIGIEERKGNAAVVTVTEELVEIQRETSAGENIVPAGAEAKAGQELLPRGLRLGPAQLSLAAAAGKPSLTVYRKPRVAILSTGDELVEVAEKPGPNQIRNSNSYSLAAEVAACGGEAVQLPIAPDEAGKLTELIQEGLKADLLLLSGGVSMGKFDLVEHALKNLGAAFFFTGALIQPGRPVVFGETGAVPFFGLPGNPVSVMVTFELFARQVVETLGRGEPSRLKSAKVRLAKSLRTKTGLTRFLPARMTGGLHDPEVEVVPWQGSGDMLAAAHANCYLVVPPDRESLTEDEMVTVVIH